MRRWIFFIIAGLFILILAGGAGFFILQKEEEGGRAVLYRTEEDTYYVLKNGTVEKEYDDAWKTCIVEIGDQFDAPASISLNYTADEKHLVVLYTEDYSVNGRWILEKGTHKIEFSPNVAYLYISVLEEEEAQLNLTAYGQKNTGSGKYRGKYLSVLGDSISSYEGYLTEGCLPAYNKYYNMKVSDMWWYEMARITGMNICAINASGGSGVTDLNGNETMGRYKANSDRSRHLDSPGHTPDVICVLLGINDFFQQVDYEQFSREYGEMVDIIQDEYPNAELFLCTYFELPGPYKAGVDDLNAIVKEVAAEKGAQVLDIHGSKISESDAQNRFTDYDAASGNAVHPNAAGQKLMGQWAAKLLNGEG